MDKKYVQLFTELARATAVTSEQVMDYDKKKNDEKGYAAAQKLRDDFQQLHDTIKNAGDEYVPDRNGTALLLLGALIQANQINDRITAMKKAMTGYQSDIIPKLQSIMDEAKTDEEAINMANEKFIIEETK